MSILVTGGTGKLGSEIRKLLPDAIYPTRAELDLTWPKSRIHDVIKGLSPEIVIHCGAMTGIKECDANPALAYATNVWGSYNLANASNLSGSNTRFVYVSTACVFSGKPPGHFNENSSALPKNVYSLTKYIGEKFIESLDMNSLIIRTNFIARGKWPYPKAFVDRWANYLQKL